MRSILFFLPIDKYKFNIQRSALLNLEEIISLTLLKVLLYSRLVAN